MPIVNIYITGGVDRNVADSNAKNKAGDKETERQGGEPVTKPENLLLNQQTPGCLNIALEIRDNFNGRLLPGTRKHKLSIPLPTQDFWNLRDEWKNKYAEWLKQKAKLIKDAPINIDPEIRVSPQACQQIGDRLSAEFNSWINYQNKTISALRAIINPDSYRKHPNEFCFILHPNTGDSELDLFLQRLPSHDWDFLQTLCPGAEISLSTTSYAQLSISNRLPRKILAIVGDDPTIPFNEFKESIRRNIPDDIAEIEYWSCREGDPNTGLRSTNGAIPDLRLTLEASSPQGIIFIGHSESTLNPSPDGSDLDAPIRIHLNQHDSISLENPGFQRILRGLQDRGLIFAIFISCDGLRIFPLLNDLGIPYLIVSREILPVDVARIFLDKFLAEAVKPGVPLHIALSRARQYLRNDIEHGIDGCPNASNLPVIGQDPDFPFYILNPELVVEPQPSEPTFAREEERNRINKILKIYKTILIFALLLILGLILALILHQPAQVQNVQTDIQQNNGVADLPISILKNSDISFGDKPFINGQSLDIGFDDFANGRYADARSKFQAYLKSNKNSPEILIAINNSIAIERANKIKQKPLRIGVGVPSINNIPVAREILAGIAMYQQEVIDNNGILQIAIGRDSNDEVSAVKIANAFAGENSILAVVGHNASEASIPASKVYSENHLVMLSPTSFEPTLSDKDYIYQMVSQMGYFASQLQKEIERSIKIPKLSICLDPKSPDNKAFQEKFSDVSEGRGNQYQELNCKNFADINNIERTKKIIEQIQKNNSNSILVSPHINSIDKAMKLLRAIRNTPELSNIQLFGSPSFYTHAAESTGVETDGLTISVPYFPNLQNPYQSLFFNKYRSQWNEDLNNWRTPMTYASVKVINEALMNQPDRTALNQLLHDTQKFSTKVIDDFHFESNKLKYFNTASKGVLIKLNRGKFTRLPRS
jgi:branched-chain amino acid transport system substrate-binding protein